MKSDWEDWINTEKGMESWLRQCSKDYEEDQASLKRSEDNLINASGKENLKQKYDIRLDSEKFNLLSNLFLDQSNDSNLFIDVEDSSINIARATLKLREVIQKTISQSRPFENLNNVCNEVLELCGVDSIPKAMLAKISLSSIHLLGIIALIRLQRDLGSYAYHEIRERFEGSDHGVTTCTINLLAILEDMFCFTSKDKTEFLTLKEKLEREVKKEELDRKIRNQKAERARLDAIKNAEKLAKARLAEAKRKELETELVLKRMVEGVKERGLEAELSFKRRSEQAKLETELVIERMADKAKERELDRDVTFKRRAEQAKLDRDETFLRIAGCIFALIIALLFFVLI